MKFHGIQIEEGSKVTNLSVDTGTAFPSFPDEGELFFRSDADVSLKGLYCYIGGSWDRIGTSDALTAPVGIALPSTANPGDIFYLNSNDGAEGLYVYNDTAWVSIAGGGISAPLNQILFGTGGTVNSDPDFTYNTGAGSLFVNTTNGTAGSVSSLTPGAIGIFGATNTSASGQGGTISIVGGNSSGSADGGQVIITGGNGGSNGLGGTVVITGGRRFNASVPVDGSVLITGGLIGIPNSDGDAVTLKGGAGDGGGAGGLARVVGGVPGTTGNGGGVLISGSVPIGANKNGGSVTIEAANPTGSGIGGSINLVIPSNGSLRINSNAGNAGQYLISQGASAPPVWTTVNNTITLSGDITGTGVNSIVTTLATVNSSPGTFGTASSVGSFQVNAKGLVTSASSLSISIDTAQVATGTFANARISQTSVTQHQAALSILESQLVDGTLLSRNAANETITGSWTFNTQVSGVTPISASHLATKDYVDTIATGLSFKQSVRATTTANITLSGTQTIDGVSLVAGNRVLVKDQTTGSQNGIYVVAAGAWTRATDFDGSPASETASGAYMFVREGTLYGNSGWVLSTPDPITLGTTSLSFTQFTGLAQIDAGAGLSKTGSTLNVGTASTSRIVVNTDDIDLAFAGSAGTYRSVTTDVYGRVVAGTNPTTLAGYGITDAVLKTGDTMTGALAVDLNANNIIGITTTNSSNTTGAAAFIGAINSAGAIVGLAAYSPTHSLFPGQTWLGAETTDIYIGSGAGVTPSIWASATTKNVGIKKASADTALDVNGTVTATAFSGPLTGNVTGAASLNVLKAGDTMTGDLVISQNVNVGAGVQITNSNTGNAASAATVLTNNAAKNLIFEMIGSGVPSYSNQAWIYTTGTVPIVLSASGGTIGDVYITTSGNMVIGDTTASTGARLTVVGGNVRVRNTTPVLGLQVTATGTSQLQFLTSAAAANGRVLYDFDSNFLSLWTNSAERMRIDSTGNVGIAITAPQDKLHVADTFRLERAGSPTQYMRASVDAASNSITSYSAVNNAKVLVLDSTTDVANTVPSAGQVALLFRTLGVERARIDSAGRLLIGNGTPNLDEKVGIYGPTNSSLNLRIRNTDSGAAASSAIALNASGNTWGIECGSSAKNGNALTFQVDYGGANTERMRIDTAGNVGIGVVPAGERLMVLGNVRIAFGTAPEINAGRFFVDGSVVGLESRYSVPLTFGTSAIERMRIDNAGNVLVNRTTNSGLGVFQVAGNMDVSSLTNTISYIRTNNSANFASLRLLNDLASSSRALEIDYSGSTYAGSLLTSGPTGESASIATTGAYPLAIGTNNTARIIVDTSGNTIFGNGVAGIGSTSTFKGVQIRFDATNNIGYISSTQSGVANYTLGFNALDHRFFVGGTERMRIDSAGNVGVGITPTEKFHISGGALRVDSGSSVWGKFGSNATASSFMTFAKGGTATVVGYLGTDGGGILGGATGDNFGIRSEGALLLMAGGADTARILGNGTLVVNASSPGGIGGGVDRLAVNGTIGFTSQLNAAPGTNNPMELVNRSSGGGFEVFTNAGAQRPFRISSGAATDTMVISSTSSVIIGTSTTGTILLGTSTNTYNFKNVTLTSGGLNGIQHIDTAASGSLAIGVESRFTQAAATNFSFFQGVSSTSTINFRVLGNGNVQNTNNSYGAISDQRLKSNIVDAGSQWNDIKGVRVRKFKMNDDLSEAIQIGVVAQEIETISPGLVEEVPDDEHGTIKTVKYSVLYMKAVKALQEAMNRIEQLEARVSALETK